jgi:hypothetical protein
LAFPLSFIAHLSNNRIFELGLLALACRFEGDSHGTIECHSARAEGDSSPGDITALVAG